MEKNERTRREIFCRVLRLTGLGFHGSEDQDPGRGYPCDDHHEKIAGDQTSGPKYHENNHSQGPDHETSNLVTIVPHVYQF